MGWKFRRSIKILPGVRVNIGKKGITSTTIGRRGASVNIGKKGAHANVGLRGTGLSYRSKIASFDNEENSSSQQGGCAGCLLSIIKFILIFALVIFIASLFLPLAENKSNKKEAEPINTEAPINVEKQTVEKSDEEIDNDEQLDDEELNHSDSTTEEKIDTIKENLF